MKIAVYAIAKNEEKHSARWAASAAQADYRIVLDTGSTDSTVLKLQEAGVTVHSEKINPWRFDTARNRSLELVPSDADICIALDLDEILMPGWREALERAWTPNTTLLRYPFVSTWKEDGKTPDTVSYGFKIHARHAYTWKYALHEILRPLGAHNETTTEELRIHQYQDATKDRTSYIPQLEELVAQEPSEPRYRFYLGRHYFDAGKYEQAITILENFLDTGAAEDLHQRSFAFRLMAWSHQYLKHNPAFELQCLLHATAESPLEREPWVHLAEAMDAIGNWPNCFSAAANALQIKDRTQSYIIDLKAWEKYPVELFEKSGHNLGIPQAQLDFFKKSILKI